MAHHNLQKPLQPLPPMLNHIITKPIRKHLPRQRRDRDTRALALQDIAEVFEVGVAAADGAVFELEGGDVGAADDFVVGVHAARGAVGLRILDLWVWREVLVIGGEGCGGGGAVLLSQGSFRGARKSPRSSAGVHRALPASWRFCVLRSKVQVRRSVEAGQAGKFLEWEVPLRKARLGT